MGVDLVVLGLAAVDGFHVKGVAEDEGDAFGGAEVGEPVPGEHALGGDDQVVAEGGDGIEEGARLGGDFAVQQGGAGLVEDAKVERPGVQIDAAVKLVGFWL